MKHLATSLFLTVLIALGTGTVHAQSGGDLGLGYPLELPAVNLGDTVCSTFYLHNYTDSTLEIDSLYPDGSGDGQYTITPTVTLPAPLAAGDSLGYNVCFANTGHDWWQADTMTVVYEQAGVRKTASTGLYTKVKQSTCLSANYDWPSSSESMGYVNFSTIGSDSVATSSLMVHNPTSSAVTITGVVKCSYIMDSSRFQLTSPSLPLTLQPGDSQLVTFTFDTKGAGLLRHNYSAGMLLQVFSSDSVSSCSALRVWLSAETMYDSLSISLAQHAPPVLNMNGNGKHIQLKNDGTEAIEVLNMSLKQGFYYKLSLDHAGLPMVLHPGESLGLTVSLQNVPTDVPGTYPDAISIETNFGTEQIALQAFGTAGVPTTVSDRTSNVNVSVWPTPTTHELTVDAPGLHSANIEVYNELGVRVAKYAGVLPWTWSPELAPGRYFLRLEGSAGSSTTVKTVPILISGN